MAENVDFLSRILKRDQLIILSGVIALVIISWVYLAYFYTYMHIGMESLARSMVMPQISAISLNEFLPVLLMWSAMMIAMMLPSATPMVLAFSAINRKRSLNGNKIVPTWVFLSSYILVWIGFSLFAAILHLYLKNNFFLSEESRIINPIAGGIILMAAGFYQFTPIKHACVKNCQSPLGFVMEKWREGRKGAFWMGLQHGGYCVGCCWVLMLLLFFAGIMNLIWIAAISIFIFLEKIIVRGRFLGYFSGSFLLIWGLYILL